MNNDKCDLISIFADGYLNEHQADIIRHHIGQCEQCARDLHMYSQLSVNILKPPILQSRLMDACDDIINTVQSMEQQAVFSLLNEGVKFSQMRLFRILEPMEVGIMVDGEVVCSIKLRWPTLADIMFRDESRVDITISFLPPYAHLNK